MVKIPEEQGAAALAAWRAQGAQAPRSVRATAVRYTLQLLAQRAPGSAVEVRVPPFGAVQCIPGPGHSRGTPPNVIEVDPTVWLQLATGALDWDETVAAGRLRASGTRATLAELLPLR